MGIAVSLVFGIGDYVDILEGHEERMCAVNCVVLGCDACGTSSWLILSSISAVGGEAGLLDHILAT